MYENISIIMSLVMSILPVVHLHSQVLLLLFNVPADFALDTTLTLNQTGRQIGELELQNSDFNNFANFAHDCSSVFPPKSPIGQ